MDTYMFVYIFYTYSLAFESVQGEKSYEIHSETL